MEKRVNSTLSFAFKAKASGGSVQEALQKRNESRARQKQARAYKANRTTKAISKSALADQLGITRQTFYQLQDQDPKISGYQETGQKVIEDFNTWDQAKQYARSLNEINQTSRFYVSEGLSGYQVLENLVTRYTLNKRLFMRKDLYISQLASTRLTRYNRRFRKLLDSTDPGTGFVMDPAVEPKSGSDPGPTFF